MSGQDRFRRSIPNLSEPPNPVSWGDLAALLLLVIPGGLAAIALGYESTRGGRCDGHTDMGAIAHWFDPTYFQYNLLLAFVAIAIVPAVPYTYVRNLGLKKIVRLFC